RLALARGGRHTGAGIELLSRRRRPHAGALRLLQDRGRARGGRAPAPLDRTRRAGARRGSRRTERAPAVSRGLAVVTGASAGIGREFAEQLGARGHDLLLVARDGARLSETAATLAATHGVSAEALPLDLSRDEDVTRLAERLAATPGLSLLVN